MVACPTFNKRAGDYLKIPVSSNWGIPRTPLHLCHRCSTAFGLNAHPVLPSQHSIQSLPDLREWLLHLLADR
jgi:hypothetical protein